jgi:hypothetical protein
MRIAFVTSSLEPGKDGVGDYTRRLAAACHSLGHSCVLVALNDRYIQGVCEEQQCAQGATLDTLRLPASNSWPERLAAAQYWLECKSPEWVSLQFVAYGFHRKGLIGDLGRRLASLVTAWPLQLMLHELWIGMELGATLRERLVGRMQRQAVLSLVRHLNPAVVSTSNAIYATLLRERGVDAHILPLCGNIPVALNPDMEWLGREIMKCGVPEAKAMSRERCWRFGIFGSLHPGWSSEPLFHYLSEAARQSRREVVIVSAGRRGPDEYLWHQLERRYGNRFSFAVIGERSLEDISVFLQSIDFGIALTPWQLIAKSGATAAMLDHGVPVIVSRDDVNYGVDTPEMATPLLYRMDSELPLRLLNARRQSPRNRMPELAERFIADIDAARHLRSVHAKMAALAH